MKIFNPTMAYKWTFVVAFACVVSVSVGCKSTDPATPSPDTVSADQYPNIVLDPDLEDALVRTAPNVRPAADGQPLRISVPIRSICQVPLNLRYRVLYYDRFGKQTNRNPVWRDIHMMARARHIISDNAISLDAVDWTIEVISR